MTYPTDAVIAITYKCNSRCIMCEVWKDNQNKSKDIDPIYYSKIPPSLKNINISGGEPFLRSDLSEIIEIIQRRCKKARIVISSNGLAPKLIERQLSKILRIKKDIAVRISVDGFGDNHEKIRNIKDAFSLTQESLKIIKHLKVKDIGISSTITDSNISDISLLFKYSKQENINFTICGTAHNSEIPGYFGNNNNLLIDVENSEKLLKPIIRERLKSWSPANWARAYYKQGILYKQRKNKRLLPCGALAQLFYMDPFGEIFSCNIVNKTLGNIRDNTFEELWNSKKANNIREFVKRCPHQCWMICTVSPYLKKHFYKAVPWIVLNKIKVHSCG